MKKLIWFIVCVICVGTMPLSVNAEDGEALVSVDLTASSAIKSEMKGEGWSFAPDNDEAYDYTKSYGLRFGHYWTQNNAQASIELPDIGLKYICETETTMSTNGAIYIPAKELPTESCYTGKTRITNGYYLLEYSVEINGIYGRDETNTWTLLYPIDAPGLTDVVKYRAEVEGDTAVIYRNDEKLFDYTLPECSEGGKYSYSVKSLYGKGGASCLRKINITKYEPEVKYTDFSADKKVYKNGIIPASTESVNLIFNLPCSGITAQIKENGAAVEADTELDGKYFTITPKTGFNYGCEYTLELESEDEITGLPETIEFKTAEDDFIADSCVFNKDSADIEISNYSGEDTEICAVVFVYRNKQMISMSYNTAKLADGESVSVNIGNAETDEYDTVKLTVFDSIENMKPLIPAIIKEK